VATLSLVQLTCLRKNDVIGKDEPRLSVNNRVVWNGSIDKGGTAPVNKTVTVTGTAAVKLEEMDNNGNNARQIGSVLSVNTAGGNPPLGEFKNAGSHYELLYRVHA
jgi:hypothetical protein